MPNLGRRYFVFRSFGMFYGIEYASFPMGVAAAPPLMGMAFDRTGGYRLPLGVMLGMLAVAVFGAALLPKFTDAPEPTPSRS